ncbi:DNA repair protein XRCC1-like isoform X2 [Daphnia carinata]|uniref:DNA repair protein XRCC1-like isoform X2 n=1 Tax=Daphnia carinata TaxID=120202 RepID=UPI00257AFC6D|nr:DNA repair protein XRCC1-like isoform X2 [Daphnia carinata]
MAPIKLHRVISFSSEDPNQPTENLIKDGAYRKWRCKTGGEQKAWVELQLEKPTLISAIDIGNHGSAFIEILVGRSGCPDEEYKTLLNSATFMTPQECRNETNLQRVRIFKHQDLNKATQTEKWDRVKVICTQPFNKQLQYGISFITIHAPEEESFSKVQNVTSPKSIDFGMFKLKDELTDDPIKQGSLFSRFKSFQSPMNSSPKPGAIRAASQSLASVALAQSEKEAVNILKQSPKKDGRPDIKLTDKLKTLQYQSPTASKTHSTSTEIQSLPSRKLVESDRIRSCVPSTPPPTKPSNKKLDENKLNNSISKHSRKEESVKRKAPPSSPSTNVDQLVKKQRITKPFNRLLDNVVVVLSGFQNPLRSQLRDKLQALGATYKPEWNASCTHLVCAFYNTPKFLEVKGKGKIVTKNWVEDCYAKRKRLPWRRYCLDKNDRGEESEEEILAGPEDQNTTSPAPKRNNNVAASVSDTATGICITPKTSTVKEDEDDYGGSTEVDEVDTDDEIDMIKKKILQEQKLSKDSQSSNIYNDSKFLLGKDLSEDFKEELTRYVTDLQGQIVPKRRSSIKYFVTDNPDDAAIAKVLAKNKDIQIVKSDWIRECKKQHALVNLDPFLIALSK